MGVAMANVNTGDPGIWDYATAFWDNFTSSYDSQANFNQAVAGGAIYAADPGNLFTTTQQQEQFSVAAGSALSTGENAIASGAKALGRGASSLWQRLTAWLQTLGIVAVAVIALVFYAVYKILMSGNVKLSAPIPV